MFYSLKNKTINQSFSYLNTERVFTGQYWDEFGVTSHLVPENSKVLMLGLSFGGGIRPILSSQKKIELTCIDLNVKSNKECLDFYKTHFPSIKFDVHTSDAITYIEKNTTQYDCIWLDIYENESYYSLYFNENFISKLKKSLTPKGILMVNSYGIPNQFSPLEKDNAQSKLLTILQKEFSFITQIPYRRNITFIAAEEKPQVYSSLPHPDLNSIDKFSFNFIKSKIQFLENIKRKYEVSIKADELLFSAIDVHMRNGWNDLRSLLKLKSNAEILEIIQNQERSNEILKNLEFLNNPISDFFPILIAGESNLSNLQVDWFFEWIFENSFYLKQNASNYKTIWLPQLWSMIIQPSNKFKKHYFRTLNLIQREFQ